MNLQPLLVIIVGLIVLSLIWRVIKGVIRLVLTVAVLLLVAYLVMTYLR